MAHFPPDILTTNEYAYEVSIIIEDSNDLESLQVNKCWFHFPLLLLSTIKSLEILLDRAVWSKMTLLSFKKIFPHQNHISFYNLF